MKRTHTLVAGVIAGVALTLAAAIYAQPFGGGPGMGMGMGPDIGMGADHGMHAGVDPSAMVESHLTHLKTQLQITPAQEPAWQAFTTQVRQQAASMQALHAQMQDAAATAPERMAQHALAMQQRAAGMTAMSNALTTLYATLTPEQRAIADQRFGVMGHHGKHGPRGS